MPIRNLKQKKERNIVVRTISGNEGNMRGKRKTLFTVKKATRSFLEGFGSVLDISGGSHVTDPYFLSSDTDRLRGDWERIGKDLRAAMNNYDNLYGHEKQGKARTVRSKGFSIL